MGLPPVALEQPRYEPANVAPFLLISMVCLLRDNELREGPFAAIEKGSSILQSFAYTQMMMSNHLDCGSLDAWRQVHRKPCVIPSRECITIHNAPLPCRALHCSHSQHCRAAVQSAGLAPALQRLTACCITTWRCAECQELSTSACMSQRPYYSI